MQRKWLLVSLMNLLIAVSIGALLRFAYVEEISWLNFKNFLHAHSHIAMLGWVYLALYTFLVASILPKNHNLKKYNWLFWFSQISVLGMLISFPLMGYASWSIGFSVLQTLLSYVFVFYFFRDLKHQDRDKGNKNRLSVWWIKAGLFFLIFSTLGLWAMGPLMAMGLQGSAWYYSMIQYYLHFQFNGWFIFSILGLVFRMMENNNINIPLQLSKRFFYFLLVSCFLTYALAVTWSTPLPILFIISSLGALLQLIALFYFLKIAQQIWEQIHARISNSETVVLFKISFFSFVLKIIIQSAVIIPAIGIIGYTIRNYVIGFLHLMLIGMVTLFLFGFGMYLNLIRKDNYLVKYGIRVFIVGFILSELILFLQGTMFWGAMGFMPYYYELLFGVSVMLPVGLFLILIGQLFPKEIF